MTVRIRFVPSEASEVEGISADFDGERVSYNGDYYSSQGMNFEYRPYDGYGITFDNDFQWSGEIRRGTKVIPYNSKNAKKIAGVRVRISSYEATWNEAGGTSRIPEITYDGENWGTAYGTVPAEMKKEQIKFFRQRDLENLAAYIRQRIRNNFKCARHEIIAECEGWSEYLKKKEAVKIGLDILKES